jgi:hypothetical protein
LLQVNGFAVVCDKEAKNTLLPVFFRCFVLFLCSFHGVIDVIDAAMTASSSTQDD